jgi:hypothetical protein
MTHTTISHTKDRLRDEAQLAFMAYAERGGVITTIRPSLAPVCVPCYSIPKAASYPPLSSLLAQCQR